MPIPYENATSGEAALGEASRILARFGCQAFGTMTDAERGVVLVQFKLRDRQVSIEASWHGYAALWLKANPWTQRTRATRQQHETRALEQARVSVCSVLRDWIKGQVTAIECGMLDFDTAFLPHLLLSNGKRVAEIPEVQRLIGPPLTATTNILKLS